MELTVTYSLLRKNNKGSFTLFLALSLLVLISLFSMGLMQAKKHIFLQQRYIKAHKCMTHTSDAHRFYTERIILSNQLIRSTNIIGMVPKLKITMHSLKKLLQFGQEVIYLDYLRTITSYKYCKVYQITDYLNSLPFKRSNMMFFKREKSGAIKIKKRTYKKYIWFKKLKLEVKDKWKILGTKNTRKTKIKEI